MIFESHLPSSPGTTGIRKNHLWMILLSRPGCCDAYGLDEEEVRVFRGVDVGGGVREGSGGRDVYVGPCVLPHLTVHWPRLIRLVCVV